MLAEESETQDGIYVLTILPFSIFIILLKYLNGFVWLRDYELVYQALLLFGIIMLATGSLWSVFQTRIKKLVGYLVIIFTGFILIAIGLNSAKGFAVLTEFLLVRSLNLFLLMLSLLMFEKKYDLTDIQSLRSMFYKYRFASIGLLISLFTIPGMPLTPGFLPLLTLYRETSMMNLSITVIMLVSNALLTIYFARILLEIMHPDEDELDENPSNERLVEKILIASITALNIIIGLFPNFVFSSFHQILGSFEYLVK